jgi:hypothetical protein
MAKAVRAYETALTAILSRIRTASDFGGHSDFASPLGAQDGVHTALQTLAVAASG